MALSAPTKPLCVAQGVGCDRLAGGLERGSRHLHRGRGGHSISSRDTPGLPVPTQAWSQPRLSLSASNSLLIPKEKKGLPCPRHFGHRSTLGGARPGLCEKLEPRRTVFAFGDQEV